MGTLSMALLAGTTSPPRGNGDDTLTLPKDWNPYWRTEGSPSQYGPPQAGPSQYGPPRSNFDSRNYNSGIGGGGGGGGFSKGFLNYLADARAMKLREKEAGIGLTGAQTGKIGAETADIYGMTAPSQMKMNLMGSQIDETYGRTAPTRASMANIYADIAGKYGLTAPSMANMYATYGSTNADLMRAGGSRTTTMKNLGPFGGETTTTSPNFYFSNPMAGGGGFPMAGGGGGGFNTPTGGLTAQSIFDAYEKAQKAKAIVKEGREMIEATYGKQLDRRGRRLPYNYIMG